MSEDGADDKARQWSKFTGRRNPVVWQPKVVRDDRERLVIRPTWFRRVMAVPLLAVAAVAAGIIVVNPGPGLSWLQWVGLMAFSLVMGYLGLVLLLEAARVTVDPSANQLMIRGGYWPRPRCGIFALSDVRQRLCRREMPRETNLIILLRHDRHRGLIRLIQGDGWEIARVADVWPDRGAPLADATTARIELPDGGHLDVSTASTSPVGGSFQTARLKFDRLSRASVKPTWRIRAFFLAFVAFGAVGMMLSVQTLRDHGLVGLFPLGISLLLFVPGAAGLAGLLHRRTRIDAIAGTVTQSGQFQPFRETTTAAIAAVQLCSGREELGDASRYITYELNLVLHDPPGQRWTVMNHGDLHAQFTDGQQLANMINVPFIDHTRHG